MAFFTDLISGPGGDDDADDHGHSHHKGDEHPESFTTADGQTIDLSHKLLAKAKFAKIKEEAIARGEYGGKSLELFGGGRAKMLYDQLRVEGYTDAFAKKIVGAQFQHRMDQIRDGGTPLEKARMDAYLNRSAAIKGGMFHHD